jgi:hypothetical protein
MDGILKKKLAKRKSKTNSLYKELVKEELLKVKPKRFNDFYYFSD